MNQFRNAVWLAEMRTIRWGCKELSTLRQAVLIANDFNFLNLESLESRRVKADLVLLFKVIHGFVDIDYSAMFDIQYDRSTRIRKCHSNVNARKFHFCNGVIDVWNNCLSSYQVHLPSVNAFKRSLAPSVF